MGVLLSQDGTATTGGADRFPGRGQCSVPFETSCKMESIVDDRNISLQLEQLVPSNLQSPTAEA